MQPLLSICIPTYNRSTFLAACLESLDLATSTCRNEVEVIVSDNASTDDTEEVVATFARRFPIRYIKNSTNIGAERNFFSAASETRSSHVCIFGDDDLFEEKTVIEFLRYIKTGHDLIMANYSSWSRNMNVLIAPRVLSPNYRPTYEDANLVLSTFGIFLGYTSSVVVRRSILLSTPSSEYEVYVQYGFPFPYCIYRGLLSGVRMAYLSAPLFKRRDENSIFTGPGAHTLWIRYFVEGPALVFEDLGRHGYSSHAVHRAKGRNLKDFGVGNILSGIDLIDRPSVRSLMSEHYGANWRYWMVWWPLLVLPTCFVQKLYKLYRWMRRRPPLQLSPRRLGEL